VHEAFDGWPADFIVLAIAQGVGNTYTALDGTVGTPYILARGDGLVPVNPSDYVKWEQLPDETRDGIDVRMDRNDQRQRILADDFLCMQTGLITDVHFWASWKDDYKTDPGLTKIHLSIHADIPAVVSPDGTVLEHSRPGQLLWEHDFGPGEYTESLYKDLCHDDDPGTCIWEWWWDPYVNPPIAGDTLTATGDQKIWKYNIDIDPNIAFLQEGDPNDPIVYWLDIYVLSENPENQIGWKTARTHWNDDGVFDLPGAGWQELIYPPTHPMEETSIDLAFEITTKPAVEPEIEACCFDDGGCLDLTVADCLAQGGTPQGTGTDCSTVDCPTPPLLEACCLPDGTCVDTTVGKCLHDNGIPQGVGTSCSDAGLECPQPCKPTPVVCPSGKDSLQLSIGIGAHDNFAPGPDPGAAPDPQLLNYIVNCSVPGVPLQLDEIPAVGGVPANSWFGHTFTGLPFGIVAATLEIRVKAGPVWGTHNDHIAIVDSISGCTPTWFWQNRFKNLPEAGGTWSADQSATFCLDLDALPIGASASTTSVISQLASGRLSIRVDDDSGVDYVVLNLVVCPCEYQFEFAIPVEVSDGFSLPDTAPASPSSELTTAFSGPFRKFDQIIPNRQFGHTFTGLPPNILDAELEIGLRAGFGYSVNDALYLEFLNPSFRWAKRISDLPPNPPGSGTPIGSWFAGTSQVFVLDLDDLPPSTASVTSVIGDMADGDLDVYIQDDTAVNYMILRYKVCCKETIPGDTNHDWIVNFKDIAIAGNHWLMTGP
jgi:hypothetical protein